MNLSQIHIVDENGNHCHLLLNPPRQLLSPTMYEFLAPILPELRFIKEHEAVIEMQLT
jgi:hypothetical protein